MKSLYAKAFCAVFSGWLAMSVGYAQSTTDSDDDAFQTITTYGVTTNTNAALLGGFAFRQSKRLDGTLFGKTQYRYLSVEVVNVRHPREISSSSITGGSVTSFKENYLFVIRPQYGREMALFRRNAEEGISVNAILAAGPSLGIIKPYIIEGNTTGIFEGLGSASFTGGVHAKAAVSFELSAFRSNTTGIEIGFLAELFPNKIIIVPNTNQQLGGREVGNRSFFTSGYVTLFFGSKK